METTQKAPGQEEVSRAHGLFTFNSIISIQQILKGKIATPVVRVRSFSGEIETVIWVSDSEPSFMKKANLFTLSGKGYWGNCGS